EFPKQRGERKLKGWVRGCENVHRKGATTQSFCISVASSRLSGKYPTPTRKPTALALLSHFEVS
ncbi:MAG TPA: hypothetical protein VIU13_09580, partial [Chryseolinea sp.]